MAYDAGDPRLIKLATQNGEVPGVGATVVERYDYPLIFEPGTSFAYGASMDWVGQLVERLSGVTLEEYMKKNMWQPLGITTITFFPYQNAALKDRVPGLTMRTPEGKLVPHTAPFLNTGSKDAFGGHGAYATMADYIKVQRSILANNGKLLKPETVDLMFQPQLTPQSTQGLNKILRGPMAALFIGELKDPNELEMNWGLGGLLFMQDDVGRRKKVCPSPIRPTSKLARYADDVFCRAHCIGAACRIPFGSSIARPISR